MRLDISVSRSASAAVILVGGLVLVGWALDVPALKSVLPGHVAMKVNTALAFVLSGASLWLLGTDPPPHRRRVARACAALAALVGLFTLGEYLTGWSLGIDQLLFDEPVEAVGTSSPGRMAPTTALSFLLLGLALWLLDTRRGHAPAQVLTLAAAVVSMPAFLGYLYGVESLYGITPYTRMAIHTPGTFLILCAGALSARPDRGLMTILMGGTAGGAMARRLLPAAIGIPIAVGWLRLRGQPAGFYETEFGLSLMVMSAVVIFAVLIWWSAGSLYRTDAERRRAAEMLEARAGQQAVVVELGQRALEGADLTALLAEAVTLVARTLRVEYCKVLELSPDGTFFLLRAGVGWKDGYVGCATVDVGRGSQAGYTLLAQEPVVVENLSTEKRFTEPPLLREHGVVSGLSVVIRGRGRPFGVLGAHTARRRTFSKDDIHFFQAVAYVLGGALENARLYGEAERRRRVAEALAEVGQVIAQSLDIEEVGQRIADSVRTLVGAVSALLFEVDPKSGDRVLLALSGETGPGFARNQAHPRDSGATGLALRERCLVVTPDVLSDRRITLLPDARARVEAAPYRVVLAVPLFVQNRAVGVLAVGDRVGRVFTDDEVQLVQAFADRAAWVVESARLYKEVRDARDFLQSITESSIDAIFTTDDHGLMTYFSPGATEIFGYQPEEELGRPVADFYRGGLEEARTVMERLRVEERIRNYETAFRAKDGRWVEVNASFSLLHDPSRGIVGTMGVVKDITERKQLEEHLRQSQKMEAVGRLAGGIAHDFNNLMTIITGRAEMLLGRLRPDDPLHRDIELFRKTSERAAAVTRQLLAFSRRQVLQPKVLDVNAVVAGMDLMLRRLIGEDIDLVTALDPTLSPVRADPGQLGQVILNLAVNAREAMPNGGKLTIETGNVELDEGYASRHVAVKPGSFVLLAVSDTGMGMDEATRSRIFEPFFTTKEQGEGTGLGLATVYGIVKQSGGSIWCYSEPGRGTTFKIYLPRVDAPVESPEPEALAAAPQPGTETVLLVEDEDDLRSVAREILEMFGYTVLEAGHPDEALLVAERHSGPIHLLLTDVVMPKMSGRDLARRLVPLRPGMRVLYVSGYTDDAIVHHGVLDPSTAFLEKPFNPDDLARKVREVLDQA